MPYVGFGLKVCADGDSVWYREYRQLTGIQSSNYLQDLIPTPDGGFAGAGFLHPRAPNVGTPSEAWLFKTDANGYLQAGGAPPTVVCPPPPVGVGLPEPAPDAAVEVWPNPSADGHFTVGGLGAGATLTVCDALGRLVWRRVARGAEVGVDLGRRPAGLYLLRVTRADGRIVTKKLLR